MSSLIFKRFLANPWQIAYIVPSSKTLVRRVAGKMDFSKPRIIVEFGPGEGCHTREIVQRMHPESRLLLFELDQELVNHLKEQFASDSRIEVLNTDAANLREELNARGIDFCDYIVSGIPFSMINLKKKRQIIHAVFDSLAPNPLSAFVIYQVTNELRQHAAMFPRVESDYVVMNIPPMIVTVYYKQGQATKGGGCGCAHHKHSKRHGNGAHQQHCGTH